MPNKKDPLQRKIDELTEVLREMREEAMEEAGYTAFGNKELASFHGRIGSKNK